MILHGSCTLPLLILAILAGKLGHATSYQQLRKGASTDMEPAWREFQEFREWKISKNDWRRNAGFLEDQTSKLVVSPPIDQPALMGRFIVNQAEWTSVATISSRKDIKSFPSVNVISVSDGPLGNGTGIPYMYLTPLDFTAQDIALDNRATLMMTLAQGDYCKEKDMDPMDPRCARIHLTGRIKKIKSGNPELEVAKKAVFGRHPWLANMPPDHHFFFAKLKIGSITLLHTFGGPSYIKIKDYFQPPDPKNQQ